MAMRPASSAPAMKIAVAAVSLATVGLTACGGSQTTSTTTTPVTPVAKLRVTPNQVAAGGDITVSVIPPKGMQTITENSTELEAQQGSSWVPIYYLMSAHHRPPSVISVASGVAPASVGLGARTDERLKIPTGLSSGTYRLVKRVRAGRKGTVDISAPLAVTPAS